MTDSIVENAGFPWLSAIVLLPVAGAIALLFVKNAAVRWTALGIALADFFLSLPVWALFDPSNPRMQFVEQASWITSPPIDYHLGVDGISLPLVLLTTLLTPFCVLISWRAIENRPRAFMVNLLVMEGAMLGVFVSLDFVLFYVFWEVMLVPMYLIIGVWGGPNRLYAAIKFFLYTLTGSLLLLIAILTLFFEGGQTFDILLLSRTGLSPTLQHWLFWGFFVAFAVKVPMFPFHTWLPDAHVEAPTAGSVVLASVLLKMGAYGFLRFTLPMLPEATATFTPLVIALSLTAILYGAYMALAQADLKKLIAYSSVSHMGFVTLGIFALTPQSIEGAILQMVNHGITTGGLFLCVGILYERTHSRMIADNTGLAHPMPRYATFLVLFALSSLGLPGTNSFVGEFLVLVGTFLWNKLAAAVAALGVILAAAYLLWMVQRVAFGVPNERMVSRLVDLNRRELAILMPLVALVFWIGVFPNPILTGMHASVNHLIEQVDKTRAAAAHPEGGDVRRRSVLQARDGPQASPVSIDRFRVADHESRVMRR